MTDEPRPVVLHTSWRGRLLAFVAPVVLLAFAGLGYAVGGVRPVPVICSVVGLGLAGIVAFDYPLHAVFGPGGIERRCLLRREQLDWDRVSGVVRPAYRSALGRWMHPSTGLVATIGRRRYLLTDRMESRYEFAALTRGMDRWDRNVRIEATEPPDDTAPTWLHKKRVGGGDVPLVDHL